MALIKPFRAVIYNQSKVGDISKTVCPPYDVISSQDQQRFLSSSPYNFVRLILGKIEPTDCENENRYTRAKRFLDDWLRQEILKKEDKPAIYFYSQEYIFQGERKKRLGFIALMRLEEGNGQVFLHENTHLSPKEDRLQLLKNVEANLSPIFVLFSDKERNIRTTFEEVLDKQSPLIDITDDEKISHKLWPITDENLINKIRASLEDKHIFIADGHHRYEVAMEFCRLMRSRSKEVSPEADYNYMLTYFTNIDSRDLLILPIHRVVKSFPQDINFLKEFFRIEKIKTKHELLVGLAKAARNEYVFGLYHGGNLYLLRLNNERLLDSLITQGSREYKRLDVMILKSLIFDRLNISSLDLIYTKEAQEALSLVDKKQAQACFLLNPVKIETLRLITINNERMPPKSTYFYPKVLSGLVVNKFNQEKS
ncbi:MAG: DUF1015 domain-containing protein [Candidatus Omnitrophota bacterium]|nr:DUF1015 domain-containing protein [Candidatus Omnitrophota bacterium]